MNFPRFIFFYILLIVSKSAFTQDRPAIQATVDKKKILIGEPLQLTIQAFFPDGEQILFNPIDSIDHFEFLGKSMIDTSHSGKTTIIKGIYKITSFDSGHHVIPVFSLRSIPGTDTIGIDVVFSEFDPSRDYHDIKDIIEIPPPQKKPWWWIIAGGVLLLSAVAVYFLRKKKPAMITVPDMMIDPYREAMNQLAHLQQEKPGAKIYYSKLTDIFRLYIFRKKGILSLQKTTADLVLQLRDLNLSKEQFDKLSRALRLCDFVKFAKYIPGSEDDMGVYEIILNTIKMVEQSGS